jgi:S-adenosylmethionine:tRNA ribosyltransferase-isomerase
VRALESAASPDGVVQPGEGWTTLVVTPDRGVHAVEGIVTGWHEPAASHLQMLTAIAGEDTIERSNAAAGRAWLPLIRVRRLAPQAAVTASEKSR